MVPDLLVYSKSNNCNEINIARTKLKYLTLFDIILSPPPSLFSSSGLFSPEGPFSTASSSGPTSAPAVAWRWHPKKASLKKHFLSKKILSKFPGGKLLRKSLS